MATDSDQKPHIKDLVVNRRASYEYEILDTYEAGIVLVGTEIKSLRASGGSLQEAYVIVDRDAAWLINASITPYRFGNIHNHEEKRKRKLLLHKRELAALRNATQEKGMAIIPRALYLKNGRAKLSIAVGRGKKLYDKREAIRERDDKRAMQKSLKNIDR